MNFTVIKTSDNCDYVRAFFRRLPQRYMHPSICVAFIDQVKALSRHTIMSRVISIYST